MAIIKVLLHCVLIVAKIKSCLKEASFGKYLMANVHNKTLLKTLFAYKPIQDLLRNIQRYYSR